MKQRKKRPATVKRAARGTTPPGPVAEQHVAEQAAEQSVTEGPAPVTSLVASYGACVAEARAIAANEVVTFNGNAVVVFHNARAGVMAVTAERARIESDPDAPKVDFVRVESTVQAAEALVYAARLASNVVAAKTEVQAKVAEVFDLRDVLLSSAVAAVKAKLVSPDEAAKIKKVQEGKGPIDAAQDCVDLAVWFRHNAVALRSKTAVTAEQVARAEALGSEVLHLLSPAGVTAATLSPDAAAEAAEMRDRMAAVLARRHGYVGRVGGWLWGLDVASHVPPLRSRSVSSSASSEPAPTPPAPPVTPS